MSYYQKLAMGVLRLDGVDIRTGIDEMPPVNADTWLRFVPSPRVIDLHCVVDEKCVPRAEPGSGYIIGVPSLPAGEFAVAADMCEEYGLAEVAKMLRACEGVQERGPEVEVSALADTHRRYLQDDGTIRTGEEI